MKTQHTPGPWRVDKVEGTITNHVVRIVSPKGNEICELNWSNIYDDIRPKLLEGNAKLIAAAPEPLEALTEALAEIKACYNRIGYHENASSKTTIQIESAIKKATE